MSIDHFTSSNLFIRALLCLTISISFTLMSSVVFTLDNWNIYLISASLGFGIFYGLLLIMSKNDGYKIKPIYTKWLIHRVGFFLIFFIIQLFMPICEFLSLTPNNYKYIGLQVERSQTEIYNEIPFDKHKFSVYLMRRDKLTNPKINYSYTNYRDETFDIRVSDNGQIDVLLNGNYYPIYERKFMTQTLPEKLGYKRIDMGMHDRPTFIDEQKSILHEIIMSKGIYTLLFAIYLFIVYDKIWNFYPVQGSKIIES